METNFFGYKNKYSQIPLAHITLTALINDKCKPVSLILDLSCRFIILNLLLLTSLCFMSVSFTEWQDFRSAAARNYYVSSVLQVLNNAAVDGRICQSAW